jgi:hypothetical protein
MVSPDLVPDLRFVRFRSCIIVLSIMSAPLILLWAFYAYAPYVWFSLPVSLLAILVSFFAVLLILLLKANAAILWTSSLVFFIMVGNLIFAVKKVLTFDRTATLGTALIYHDISFVKRRIAEGADVNGKIQPDGYTMLTAACSPIYHEINTVFGERYIKTKNGRFIYILLKLLLENGAEKSINELDDIDKSAAIHSIACGGGLLASNQFRILKLLLLHRADINLKAGNGVTPLQLAVRYGCDRKVILFLLEHGANVNMEDQQGRISLHYAVDNIAPIEIIGLLLEKGAEINATDSEGKTALQIAVEQGKTDIAEYLRQNGAKE